MKKILPIFLLLIIINKTYSQEMITFQILKNILSENLKNKDIDSVMLKLGFKLKGSEQWPAQNNFHYNNQLPMNDLKYSSLDVSILLLDNKKFYIGYSSKSAKEIENILNEAISDSTYKSNNVYLSHYNQTDEFIGKEYKNGIYSISTLKFEGKYGVDYAISIGLDSEYKKTMVTITPDK